jgi:hypothetical protein
MILSGKGQTKTVSQKTKPLKAITVYACAELMKRTPTFERIPDETDRFFELY